jgi:alpha-D-ribose 1-methylphosphonate 5-triphosphate diphosphatase
MTTLTNAQLVLPDQVLNGALSFADGQITDIGPPGPGQDLAGDFLIPGLIDLHTDNLERQVLPRHNARWPSRSALLAHDAQCAAAGITTVFDALCLGDIGFEKARNQTFEDGLADLRAISTANILKTEHFLHLRCELPAPEMPALFESAIDDPLVRLISLMDHSPGLGQYADLEAHRKMREAEGFSLAEIEAMVLAQQANHHRYHLPHRALVLKAAAARNIPAASHDDRTAAEIARNFSEGIRIAEFPVAHAAAKAAKGFGIATIAGAPNIVRGGSHSGNVSVADLIADNLLDALASDYVPAAMLEAAFLATRHGRALPAAIALVTSGPAAIAGLFDRGRLAPGLRADLVQVRLHENIPVIRAVWRAGERIA